MAWSLMNHMIAEKVAALVDERKDDYPPEVKRFYSREQTLAIIHAALWGHAVRDDSTAGCYAGSAMLEALGIKFWLFDPVEAAAHLAWYNERIRAKYADQQSTKPEKQDV